MRSPIAFSHAATRSGSWPACRVALGHFGLPGLREILPFHSLVAVGHASVMNAALRHRQLERGFEFDEVARLLGSSVLTERGAKHRELRAAINQPFMPRSVQALEGLIDEEIDTIAERWTKHEGEAFDLRPDMHRVTLRIICRSMFGRTLSDETARALDHAVTACGRHMYRGVFRPWQALKRLPTRSRRAFEREIAFIRGVAASILEQHRHSNEPGLLTALRSARLAHGVSQTTRGAERDAAGRWTRPLTETELIDEVCDVLLAGHITTANLMTFMLHAVARRADVQDICATGDDDALESVWLESLRMYPTAAFLARHALDDLELDGQAIARGTMLIGVPFAIQRNPVEWQDPGRFEPLRFVREPALAQRLVAFGTGVHVCIGKHLAALEAKRALRRLCQRFAFKAQEDRELRLAEGILVEPGEAAIVRVRTRRDHAR